MKKLFLLYMIGWTAMLLMTSCESSNNGDLDGMWYMTRIDSLQSGKTTNMRTAQRTWSFQGKLMQVYNYTDNSEYYHIIMSRFDNSNGLLIIHDPFIYNRMEGDITLTADSLYRLRPYGINSVPDTFVVEKMSDQKMQISDNYLRIYFDKY